MLLFLIVAAGHDIRVLRRFIFALAVVLFIIGKKTCHIRRYGNIQADVEVTLVDIAQQQLVSFLLVLLCFLFVAVAV